jgi:uncharacterized protein with HEPN domain
MTRGKSFVDFDSDLVLRSAVERQFEILGEALNRLARLDAALAARIPDLRLIVAFRNILIHGYASIDRARVWRAVQHDLPPLQATLVDLLAELQWRGPPLQSTGSSPFGPTFASTPV